MHINCLLDNGEQVFKDSCQARIHAAALKVASNSPEQLLLVTICNGLRLGDAASVWINGVDSLRNLYNAIRTPVCVLAHELH